MLLTAKSFEIFLKHNGYRFISTDELLSTPKIIAFIPQSKFGKGKSDRESNPVPYPEQKYLSGSAFLVNLTAAQH